MCFFDIITGAILVSFVLQPRRCFAKGVGNSLEGYEHVRVLMDMHLLDYTLVYVLASHASVSCEYLCVCL